MFVRSSILIFLSLITLSSIAQTADTISVLDPVVISATLSPAQSSKTGRNLLVIKGEMIANLPVNSVDELLRYLPGLEIQARGPMGVQSDISIRGANFQQVLVILDGIRLNDPLTGHFSSYIPLPASEIERIEILKGASSAIYGTEAVGGVIHIVSKTFARTAKDKSLQAQVTGGEYGLWSVQAGARLSTEKTTVSVGLLSNHALGQPQRGTTGFFDLTTASLALSQRITPHLTLALRTAYDDRSFAAQNFYTSFASDTASETIKSWWHHGQLSYSKNNLRWITDVGYKTLQDIFAFNNVAVANNNRSKLFQVLSRATWKLSDKTSFTAGLQHIDRGIKSNDRGNHNVSQSAAFAVLHQQILPGLQIDPALRLDYHQTAGLEVVPQINISYKIDKVQLRGSAGRTIRDADFTERFNNYNRAVVPSGRIGNPDLVAEGSWSYEAGADYWAGKRWKLSATLFARNQNRIIDWVNTPYTEMPRKENLVPAGNYALAKNIWRVNTLGWETDIQYVMPITENHELKGALGLIWINNSGNEGTPSLYLSTQAKFLTNFNLMYQYKWFRVSATGLYKRREPQPLVPAIQANLSPGYFILNGKAEAMLSKQFSFFVQVDNIGNIVYSDLLGSIMPKRWTMGGINLKF